MRSISALLIAVAAGLPGEAALAQSACAAFPAGSPMQRGCYANLPLGPTNIPLAIDRPRKQCPTAAQVQTVHVVRIEGLNVGWTDIAMTISPSAATTLTHLTATPLPGGAFVPPNEDPVGMRCGAPNCRLIRVVTNESSANRHIVTLAKPSGGSVTFNLDTVAQCPDPPRPIAPAPPATPAKCTPKPPPGSATLTTGPVTYC